MRESKEVKTIVVYLNSDVGSTERDGRYEQYEPCLICAHLVFAVFWFW